MRIRGFAPLPTLFIIVAVLIGGLATVYLVNWNKYNSLSPEEKMALYNKQNSHMLSPGIYSWPVVGLTIKVPENFTVSRQITSGPQGDPEIPSGLDIIRHSGENGMASASATYSDFMSISIYKFSGDVDNFYQLNSRRKDSYNFDLVGSSRVGGSLAKWFFIKAKSPYDTGKYYEIYFVNGKYGFIFEAQGSWSKDEINTILDGISFK